MSFEEAVDAVERSIEAHGFVVVGAHDMHVTLASKGFRIHPVRIYEVREVGESGTKMPLTSGLSGVGTGRISVFTEGDSVVIGAVKAGVVTQFFPGAGLADSASRLEESVTRIVDGAAG